MLLAIPVVREPSLHLKLVSIYVRCSVRTGHYSWYSTSGKPYPLLFELGMFSRGVGLAYNVTFKNIEKAQKFALKMCLRQWDCGYNDLLDKA